MRGSNHLTEFTLDEENTTKKELHFDTTKIHEFTNYINFNFIEKVEENYIYFNTRLSTIEIKNKYFIAKCSLTDYVCEEVKE